MWLVHVRMHAQWQTCWGDEKIIMFFFVEIVFPWFYCACLGYEGFGNGPEAYNFVISEYDSCISGFLWFSHLRKFWRCGVWRHRCCRENLRHLESWCGVGGLWTSHFLCTPLRKALPRQRLCQSSNGLFFGNSHTPACIVAICACQNLQNWKFLHWKVWQALTVCEVNSSFFACIVLCWSDTDMLPDSD